MLRSSFQTFSLPLCSFQTRQLHLQTLWSMESKETSLISFVYRFITIAKGNVSRADIVPTFTLSDFVHPTAPFTIVLLSSYMWCITSTYFFVTPAFLKQYYSSSLGMASHIFLVFFVFYGVFHQHSQSKQCICCTFSWHKPCCCFLIFTLSINLLCIPLFHIFIQWFITFIFFHNYCDFADRFYF